ncbi:MAG: multicopper oxidase family protein, partial [Georgenia sp.]
PGVGGPGGAALVEPEVLSSEAGLLRVELVAARTEVELAGRQARVLTYNGSLPGATWRVRPGDRLEVRVVNTLDQPTNLHTHGLAVSPTGNGDNPFVSIAPGESFDYRFDLPEDHPSGVFWYHPHRHGTVADQVFGGMYGTIIVDGGEQVPTARDRTLVISDITLTAGDDVAPASSADVMMGREGAMVLVNGQWRPTISAAPGERERWQVVNACTSRYLRIAAPGQQVELLGIDGGHEARPRPVEEVLLAPGNRADMLVTMASGTGELVTLGYDRVGGMMRAMGGAAGLSGPATLATLAVAGPEVPPLGPVPASASDPDLRDQEVGAEREISFTMSMGAMMNRGGGSGGMADLGFDSRRFDAARTDQDVRVGTVESWTIRNPTPLDHPFHLHVWPMQVIEEGGSPVAAPTWRDVVNVPAGGRARVLVDFSRHPGRSVYHCHILDHEDAGMMATVESAPAPAPAQ